jgi:hypothetical protein
MSAIEISGIVLACTFCGSLCGRFLRTTLPENHLSAESRELVKVGMGLVGTMTALVLGLLVASAKGSYDVQGNELIDVSSNVVLLDRTLARYGTETRPLRDQLKSTIRRVLDQAWSKDRPRTGNWDPGAGGAEGLHERIQELSPKTDAQRSLQSQALALAMAAAKTRWMVFEQNSQTVPAPFLILLVCWLTVLFMSYGILAPPNSTVTATLLVCAISVSSAILLILEMYRPFEGLIQISDAPLRAALLQLGAP